jgi:uncharacterized membrane protein
MQVAADSHFKQLWVQVHSSLWFVPTLVILSLMLLALGLVELDRQAGDTLRQHWPRLFTVEAEGARSLLTTIAGSMATIAGVTFSITMVALTLASAQYTPRMLRNFMRDPGTQVVLGIFIGVFLYCLLVLWAIDEQPEVFVPACAVLGSVLLSVAASGAFIYFIHHISSNIQAAEMAQAITRETLDMIDKYFPDEAADGGEKAYAAHPEVGAWHRVPARQWGTIQTVAEHQLLAWACEHDAIVRLERNPGDFVGIEETLLWVAMTSPPDDGMVATLNGAYGIDAFRTLDQDPAFGVRQLVDMALKALSPGINDSTTAETCLDHLGVILARCVGRDLTPRRRYDRDGKLRVLSIGIDFAQLAGLAFRPVAENAQGNTAVLLRLMDTIGKVGRACGSDAQRSALLQQAGITGDIALHSAKSEAAKEQLHARLRALRDMLTSEAQELGE